MSRIVAGVDEVGRGCLAGPVVAAAVILPAERYDWIDEIKDSKKLTAKKDKLDSDPYGVDVESFSGSTFSTVTYSG